MPLLLETIKVQNMKLQNIQFHNQRFNCSRQELWNCDRAIAIEHEIQIPANLGNGIFKCRVLYGKQIEKVEFHPYQIRTIQTLQIIHADHLEYSHKYADRTELENLKNSAIADDILIIKHGLVTDTSYANIVFWDGQRWVTPATPLLNGTKRSQLLQQQRIRPENITVQELKEFQYAKLINAMIDLDESPLIREFKH
jgi:4-amino-4-deoxychorismate lyase